MTVKLSRHKVSRILRYYFRGMTQPVIAQRVGVDQSTVSLYATSFKKRAAVVGLLAAGREFGMITEINELRSLSVELLKSNLTAEDARQGVRIIKAFQKLGIEPERHTRVIQMCKKIDDPHFINAALKLNRIEAEGQMSYEEALAKYDLTVSQIPSKKTELSQMQTKLDSLNSSITEKNKKLHSVDTEIKQRQREAEIRKANLEREAETRKTNLEKEAETRKAKLEQEYTTRGRQLDVTLKEMEEVAELKTMLRNINLDIPTFIQLAKEAIYGSATS